MPLTFGSRVKNAWNAFRSRDQTSNSSYRDYGAGYPRKPDRPRLSLGSERSIIASLYNRIAIDVAAIQFQHIRVDQNGNYQSVIDDGLNRCLTISPNLDQISRALFQDAVLTMFEDGCVAFFPVETTSDPNETGSYDILKLRVGRILEWYPQHVRISGYDERDGLHHDIIMRKDEVAIVENPLYIVMNEPNSTLRRLIRKMNLLDGVDEQTSSGKLDLIIQLPYTIRSEARMKDAEKRRRMIEDQLSGSKYGVAYIDGTERVTQLNRSVENNLLHQIEYLTGQLFNQMGVTEKVFSGEATEQEMLNYHNRTIEPIVSAFSDSMTRSFLTPTAYTQGQRVGYFRNPFKLVPVGQMADIADKYTRNEVLSSNEVRAIVGYKPVNDDRANELRNKNLNVSEENPAGSGPMTTDTGSGGEQQQSILDALGIAHDALSHSGVKGQKWGVRNGPPYPLDQDTARIKSLEKKLGTAYSLNDDVLNQYKSQYRNLSHVRISDDSRGKLFVKNGKVTAMVNTDLAKTGKRQIQGIEVFGDSKGKGYSRELLDYAVKDLGAKELTVRKTNSIAKHLYDTYGFKTYSESEHMYFMRLEDKK